MNSHKQQKGFTLVELLVVIGVIGLLSTLAIIALGSARTKARDAKRISDVKDVRNALELYFADYGNYPVMADGVVFGSASASCLDNSTQGWAPTCEDPYLATVQADPGKYRYIYRSADGESYTIQITLESQLGNLLPGDVIATPSGISN